MVSKTYLEDVATSKRWFIVLLATDRVLIWFHVSVTLNTRSGSCASDSWEAMDLIAIDDEDNMFSSAEILELLALGDIAWGQSFSFAISFLIVTILFQEEKFL